MVLLWNNHPIYNGLPQMVMEENSDIIINNEARTNSECTLHVCRTGKKKQYYTLYHEGLVILPMKCATFCNYQGNLSHQLDKAVAKARVKMAEIASRGFFRIIQIEVWDSPRLIYSKMEAFGTQFKTAKSGKVMWAYANEAFWEHWRNDKQAVKDAGFWVKKMNGEWMVFVKTVEEDVWDYS